MGEFWWLMHSLLAETHILGSIHFLLSSSINECFHEYSRSATVPCCINQSLVKKKTFKTFCWKKEISLSLAPPPPPPPPILLCILWTKYMSWPLYPTWPKIHQSRNSSNVDSTHSPFNSWYSTTSKAFCFYLDANLCSLSPCHSNASCEYAQGSVNCTCQTGFQGNGFTCSGKLASML